MPKNKADNPSPASASGVYQGLARKYRPLVFEELVGQQAVSDSMSNALAGGRLVQAHLMAGPRGVGKTTSARILARCINCEKGPTSVPCGECRHCRDIPAGSDMDVVEIDAASNTQVDKTRELLERTVLSPFGSRCKVYIIDEVHMLSMASFNALLKTLEEPPEHVVFIFATTELEKVPETVRSRCVVHQFRRLAVEDIVRRLEEVSKAEGLEAETPAAREVFALIARSVDGGMRDALVTLDQLLGITGGKLDPEAAQLLLGVASQATLAQTIEWLGTGDAKALIAVVDDLVDRGRSLERFIKGLIAYVHDVMLLQADSGCAQVGVAGPALEQARELAKTLSQPAVFNILNQLFELEERMKRSTQGRFLVEFAFLRMATVKPLVPIDEVIEQLRAMPDAPAAQPAPVAQSAPTSPASKPAAPPGQARLAESEPARAEIQGATFPAATQALLMSDSGPPETATAAGISFDGLSPEEIVDQLVPQLPEAYQFLGRYLRRAVGMRADESALWIQWAADDSAGPRMIANPDNKNELERTVAQIRGRPTVIKSSTSSEVNLTAPASAASGEPARSFSDGQPEPVPPPDIEQSDRVPPGFASEQEAERRGPDLSLDQPDESKHVITSASTRELIKAKGELARRAEIARGLLGGVFIDGQGRRVAI